MSLPLPTASAQLFYDGRCPLCAREMALLRKHAHAGLTLVDIHSLVCINDAEREQLLRDLHLLQPDGRWQLGVGPLAIGCGGECYRLVIHAYGFPVETATLGNLVGCGGSCVSPLGR